MVEEEIMEDTRLGRYLLVHKLGHGGMGEVYRALAYGAAGVVKTVCIKRILAEKADKYWRVESFIEEARLSMQLSHTNIVSVFDFGVAEGGYYLAMEWIDGVDLMSFVRQRARLAPAIVAFIGSETCRGLARAHQGTEEGGAIIHRDVKPSNILISRRGEVKLADFGIAVLQGGQRSVAGTPGYMSPEQEDGALVDGRADIYGLGVSLLEIAIGGRSKNIERSLDRVEDEALRIALGTMLEPDPALRAPTAEIIGKRFERMVATALASGEDHPRDLLAAEVAKLAKKTPPTRRVKKELIGTESLLLAPSEIRETPAAKTARVKTDLAHSRRALPLTRASSAEAEPSEELELGRFRARWALALFGLGFTLTLGLIFLYRGMEGVPLIETEGAHEASHDAMERERGAPSDRRARPSDERYLTPLGPPIDVRHLEEGPLERAREGEAPDELGAAPAGSSIEPKESALTGHERRSSSSASPRDRQRSRSRTSASAQTPISKAPSAAPEQRGTLNISVRPWAHVYVNGERKGETPILGLSLPAGEHELRLENAELAVTRVVHVTITAGESYTYRADLR